MGPPADDVTVLERLPEKARARLVRRAGLLRTARPSSRTEPTGVVPGLRLRMTLAAIAVRVRQAQAPDAGPESSASASPGPAGTEPVTVPHRPVRSTFDRVPPPGIRPAPADPVRLDEAETVDLWADWPADADESAIAGPDGWAAWVAGSPG